MRCSGSPACGPACSARHLDCHHHHRGIAGVPGSATEGCDDARGQDVAAAAIAAAGGPTDYAWLDVTSPDATARLLDELDRLTLFVATPAR